MPLRDLPPPGLGSEVPRALLVSPPPAPAGAGFVGWHGGLPLGRGAVEGVAVRGVPCPAPHPPGWGEGALLGDTQTLHTCPFPQEIASVCFGSRGLGDSLSDLSNMLPPQVSSVCEARCTVERTPGAAPRGAHRKRCSSTSSGSEDTGSDGAEWADPGEELFSRTHL